MSLDALIIEPFAGFAFMRRALAACLALGVAAGPIGAFLVARRMSLAGDAIAHAVLPGAAVGYLVAGLSLSAMTIGGFFAGLATALLAGLVTKFTPEREDASLAAFYLIALGLGVFFVSRRGGGVDLLHLLFGSILAVDDSGLILIAVVATFTLLAFAIAFRPLAIECFDPGFLKAQGGNGTFWHLFFLVLVVLNLVAAFQVMGTLMAVGLLMLPATAARFWSRDLGGLVWRSSGLAVLSGVTGLMISYHLDAPSGPAIVLTAGGFYLLSLVFGSTGSLRARLAPPRHLEA
ncbi:MAG: metal ABC transporter permease [Alphaproteobacteria bacterium]|nr:metal ABC transporter permease [Alphaproteobacteria bacterium]